MPRSHHPSRSKPDRPLASRAERQISESSLIIYGRNPVLEALRRGLVQEIVITPGAHGATIDSIRDLAQLSRIPLIEREIHAEESEAPTQGVRARIHAPHVSQDFEVLDEIVDRKPAPLVLMLDGVEDPRNFGAILRTAYAAAVDAVIFRKHRQSPLTDVVFKASAGCAALIDLYQVTNLDQTIRALKESSWWIVVAMADPQSVKYSDFDWDRPTVLVLGAEGSGVSPVLQKRADVSVKIPLFRDLDSLNVSAAAAVLLFEAAQSRQLIPEV